jgi:hypothetical protein
MTDKGKQIKMNFIVPPPVPAHINAHWILYPENLKSGGLMIGDPVPGEDIIPHNFLNREMWYLDMRHHILETKSELIKMLTVEISNNKIVYVTDSYDGKRKNAVDLIGCFIKYWFKIESITVISSFFDKILKTRVSTSCDKGNGKDISTYKSTIYKQSSYKAGCVRDSTDTIDCYRRPLTVLICGDRNSSTIFDELIRFELGLLPEKSIIIHGGCYGIDMYAHGIAMELGFDVKIYPAQWDIYGKGAGPVRNKKMLTDENPDLVLAFHPDIESSRGTKNTILQAYKHINHDKTGVLVEKGPDIYLNCLKRKTSLREYFQQNEFGDFSNI